MNEDAANRGPRALRAHAATAAALGLDAIAAVYAFSFFDQPDAMLQSMNASLKPGGLMLIVDIPSEQVGSSIVGSDAEEVITKAAAAGFTRAGENGVVPGHYALIFRKPPAPEKKEAVR